MSEYISSDVTSCGATSPSVTHRLFVATPTGQTFSLRNLARTVPAYALRAHLEIVAGIPSVTYTLHYGSQTIDSDAELEFGENVQNGALLSLKFAGDWGRLYAAVSSGNVQETALLCQLSQNGSDDVTDVSRDPDVTELAETSAVEYVRFVALFLSCQRGDYDLARWLIRTDSRLLERSTQFGRTVLHAAAAADQPKVLQLFLSSGASIYETDVFGKSPLDVATQLSCYVAERLIKYWLLRRRTAWGGSERCEGHTESDIKCSHRVGAGHSRFERRAVSALAHPPKLRTQKVNTPRLSSADHRDVTAYADRRVNQSRINTWAETGVWARSGNPGDPNGPCTDLVYETVRNARSAKSAHNVHVSRPTSFSAQSTKYYRGRFHRGSDDDDVHPHRPATANSRFRAWKTWLVELDEREAEKRLEEEQKLDRQERNERAYRRWLAKKAREGDTNDEPEVDYRSATGTTAVSRNVNAAAFQKWLDDKRIVLADADRKRRESLRQGAARGGMEKKVAYNRRVTVFEFCDTDPVAAHPPPPSDYIGAYRKWLLKKRRHEAWREDDEDDEDEVLTREHVDTMRQVLVLDGMSHEEWLAQKERERLLGNKPLVLAPKRRSRPTGSQAVCIAVVAD